MPIFSEDEIDQFIELGHVTLEQAFARDVADACVSIVWDHMPFDRNDPRTWTTAFHHVPENLDGGPFAATWTSRIHAAFDELIGAGRWKPRTAQGWWPVLFPGLEEGPWGAAEADFHVDGQQFHHHVDSRDQGLLPCFVFSDIEPGDGGTALIEGSHRATARHPGRGRT